MVIKVLTGGVGGDLRNPDDNNGLGDDQLLVSHEDIVNVYKIFTMSGADLIDLEEANAGNIHDVFSGAGNDTVFGGAGVEFIYDQSGNDQFILGGGDDTFESGKGNDVANGGSGSDWISFLNIANDTDGNTTVNTTGINCDLQKTTAQNFGPFGNDRISGFENAIGGAGADTLLGTTGANILSGGGGNDSLAGRSGADRLLGEAGNDNLTGGSGKDTLAGNGDRDRLTGGTGADQLNLFEFDDPFRDLVRFTSMSDSGTGLSRNTVDVIFSFDKGGTANDDKIDLSDIDANPNQAGNQAFLFRGTGTFTSPKGEVRIAEGSGSTLVMVDIDGDGASEMNFWVDGVTGLTASDFIL